MQQRSISELKQTVKHQKDLILHHIQQHGDTRAEDIRRLYKISIRDAKNRLTSLREERKINCRRSGNTFLWNLGEQHVAIPKPKPAKTAFNLADLPEHIARLFGFIQFTPPQGRYIAETMPNIPLRHHRTTIGNGTFGLINSLENL